MKKRLTRDKTHMDLRVAEFKAEQSNTFESDDNNNGRFKKNPRTTPGNTSPVYKRAGGIVLGLLIGIAVFIIVVAVMATVIPSILSTNAMTGQNGFVITPNGTTICNCKDGTPGEPGRKGDPGESIQGQQGIQGLQGIQGDPGICIANPTCESGATGPTGGTGPRGERGFRGYPGKDGAQGAAGPSGETGEKGDKGDQGIQGIQGIQGPNGTCDCFNLPNITIDETYVTGLLDVQGNLTCSSGTFISNTCFPNACLNFSACDLEAQSLLLRGGSPTRLIVDGGDSTSSAVVFGGDPTTGFVSNATRMSRFQTYSQTTIIEASVYTQIQTLAGDLAIRAIGSLSTLLTIASSGRLLVYSGSGIEMSVLEQGDITLSTSGPLNRILLTTIAGIQMTGNNLNVTMDAFTFTAGGSDIYFGGNVNTLVCNSTLPLGVDTTANSVTYEQDIILRNGAQIISAEGSGELSLGPFISVCGGMITSPSGTLTVQGNLDATGDITASGSCCASDERVKCNVRATGDGSVDFLGILREISYPVIFDWIPDFVNMGGWAQRHAKNIFGYIAQHIERIHPQAVTKRKKTVGNLNLDDFRNLNKDELVPIAIGAILDLDKKVQRQQELIEELLKK